VAKVPVEFGAARKALSVSERPVTADSESLSGTKTERCRMPIAQSQSARGPRNNARA
jgi:hypothetical protein